MYTSINYVEAQPFIILKRSRLVPSVYEYKILAIVFFLILQYTAKQYKQACLFDAKMTLLVLYKSITLIWLVLNFSSFMTHATYFLRHTIFFSHYVIYSKKPLPIDWLNSHIQFCRSSLCTFNSFRGPLYWNESLSTGEFQYDSFKQAISYIDSVKYVLVVCLNEITNNGIRKI